VEAELAPVPGGIVPVPGGTARACGTVQACGVAATEPATAPADQPMAVARGARRWLAATVALTVGSAVTAIALAPPGSAPPPEGLAFLLFVGSSVHVASTGWFYTLPAVWRHLRRRRARYLWCPLALLSGASASALLVPRAALYWLLLPYFGWQFFHFQKQNLGIAALAASSMGLDPLARAERRALMSAGVAATGGLLTRPSQLQLPVQAILAGFFPLALLAFAASVAVGGCCLSRRSQAQRPAWFCIAYLTSLAFGLPVFVFASPYASVAGLTIAHGLQYLLLMGLVAAGAQRGSKILQLAALCNIALLGGTALAIASDQVRSAGAGRAIFGLFLGAVMAHFVIDAGLWRMREEFPRAFLAGRLPYLVRTPGGKR
jgi:hypothetical protein